MLGQAVEVLLLLSELLLELQELLLLAHADGVVFGSALSSLEGVAARARVSVCTTGYGKLPAMKPEQRRELTLGRPSSGERRCHPGPWREQWC